MWTHIDGPVCRAYYEKIVQSSGNIITLNDSRTQNNFSSIFSHLLQSYARQIPYSDVMVSKYITDLLTMLFQPSLPNIKDERSISPLDTTLSYIQGHFTESIQIEKLAKQVSLSTYHFIRIFKKETGQTPHQYVIQMRINSAKFFLRTTGATIKEIAYNCGFKSENNFCICFKKITSMTPSEFRNS